MQRKLLSPEREDLIVRALEAGMRTIAEFSAELGVSEATVRRDLQSLEATGRLRRVHGGAEPMTLDRRLEPLFNEKTSQMAAEKSRIAELALAQINDHDSIFLDGGSTVLALARHLNERRRLTVVTNSLSAAAELLETPHRLILLGGEFRPISRTLVGPLTAHLANELHINKAFMGTIGFSPAEGMSTTDPNEAYTKELIMRRADRVYLLADSSKIGVSSLVKSGTLADVDVLITEARLPQAVLHVLHKRKIEVITP